MADPETDVDVGDDAEDPGGNASEEVIPSVLGGVCETSLVDAVELIEKGLFVALRDFCLNDGHEQIIQEIDQFLLLASEVPGRRQQQRSGFYHEDKLLLLKTHVENVQEVTEDEIKITIMNSSLHTMHT